MGKRIRAKFYPDKGTKAGKYYRRILRLLIFALLINVIVLIFHVLYVYKHEMKTSYNKIEHYLFPQKQTNNDTLAANSIHLRFKGTPLMFAGHSYKLDSIGSMFDRKLHSLYFAQTDSSKADHQTNKFAKSHYGIDVSDWQNNIDWVQVHSDTIPEKLKFFIIKATQGEDGVDKFFQYNWANAKTANTIVGAYHFYVYKDDPRNQAENYIKTVPLSKGDLFPIIDIELDCTGCNEPGIPKEQIVQDLKVYIKTIEDHYRVKPILYTYTYFYNEYLKGYFDDYWFWMSQFSSTPPEGLSFQGSEAKDVKPTIGMWQFTDNERIKGIVGQVDMSYVPVHYLDSLVINKLD